MLHVPVGHCQAGVWCTKGSLVAQDEGFTERGLRTADGIMLAFRDYGSRFATQTPILCLAGLTRNSKDFHDLAMALAPERRVVCLDARGRGRSDYDETWSNYNLIREVGDILTLLSQEFNKRCIIIGTSRGGLASLIAHGVRRDIIAGIVLNDIGPELEPAGLSRIMDYLGIPPEPLNTWDDAVVAMKASNATGFDGLDDAQWMSWAERTFREDDGVPILDYDLRLRDAVLQAGSTTADFWPQFRSLVETPVLLLRGENSDLLSVETVQKMRRVKPDMTAVTVRGRGHVPFLDEPEARSAILSFIAEVDALG